jgi:hypothetical protein
MLPLAADAVSPSWRGVDRGALSSRHAAGAQPQKDCYYNYENYDNY